MPTPLPRPPVAIIFDFDGVILDSTPLKSRAYLDLYPGAHPETLAALAQHERAHGGVTRRVKIAHYEKALFGRPGDAGSVETLARRYAELVFDAVMACRFVPGAKELLDKARGRIDMHLVSGTPLDELTVILERRGLAGYFRSVHGAPVMKPEAFARVMADNSYDPARTLAIGDSLTECEVARKLGIPFLGIEVEGEHLFPADVPVLPTLETADRLIGLA
jgi:phosphoglycolate phosphatase-like HAD superfamily hydrolase